MEAGQLHTFFSRSPPSSPYARRTSEDDFNSLSFDEQNFLLTEAIYDKAQHVYKDDRRVRSISDSIRSLDACDFLDLKETIERDGVLKVLMRDAHAKMRLLGIDE